jgi:hypothetical protein
MADSGTDMYLSHSCMKTHLSKTELVRLLPLQTSLLPLQHRKTVQRNVKVLTIVKMKMWLLQVELCFISVCQRQKEGRYCALVLAGIEPTPTAPEEQVCPPSLSRLGEAVNVIDQRIFKLLKDSGKCGGNQRPYTGRQCKV